MGSSKSVTVGYRYYMGLHFGICHGPVDALHQITVGERAAWVGAQTASGAIGVSAPELFGGDKREGGVEGVLDVMMGESTQAANGYLAGLLGAGIPAFRGILSAAFNGGLIASNNPYVKPWAFRVKRILQGWTGGTAWLPEKAVIEPGAGTSETLVDNCDSLADYTVTGSVGAILADTAIIYDTTNSNDPDSAAIRTLATPINFTRLVVEFRVIVGASGDAMVFSLLDGTGAAIFTFDPRRDQGIDAAQRPTINGVAIGTVELPDGFWYQLTLDIVGAYMTVSIRASSDQSLFYQGVIGALGPVSGWKFLRDDDVTPSLTEFGSIVFTWSTTICAGMNPAHIVYQCLSDTAWGMGYPTSAIDNASFTAAANALFDEGFGLSLLWNRQETIEAFIQVVLDHIGGMLYVKPDTGAFALKLIRDDYDRGTLPQYGPTNLVSAEDYQRQAWGETVNEITAVYTDCATGKDVPVTVQDTANIMAQSGVVAQTRAYPGIRWASLAQRVALRDLNAASTPLARIRLTATRAAWAVFPGDVFRLTWPEFAIADVVYRVLAVNRGTLQDGQIIIDAVEDIYGLPDNTYLVEQPGEWVDPSNETAPAPYRAMIETPYWDLVRNLSAADMAYVDPLSGYLETVAVRPSGDAVNYTICTKVGAADYVARGNGDFCPSATVVEALTKTTTAITLANGVDLDLVVAGGYAVIENECVLVSAINWIAGTATISRGVLDTVPDEHSASARIWFADGYQGFEQTEYADAETVDVKLLPVTGRGELALADAPADSLTFDQRQYRPYAPGKMLINSLVYPDFIGGQLNPVPVSWAHRDRLTQTAYIVEQDEASIGPEASTTYTLRVYDEVDSLVSTVSGLTGTTTSFSEAVTGDEYIASVTLLMHMNGSDNGTTFTDYTGKTVTVVNNTVTKTGTKKYGTASAYFDGNSDCLRLADHAAWRLGGGFGEYDFTVEAWIYPIDFSVQRAIVSQRSTGDADNYWGFRVTTGGVLQFYAAVGGSVLINKSSTTTVSTGVFTHVAVCRASGVTTLYVGGVGSSSGPESLVFPGSSSPLTIGVSIEPNTDPFYGYIDDLRITGGVARYTANFTPPAVEFAETLPRYSSITPRIRFELESVRGGLASYQKHNHEVRRTGYGLNYGMYYG